MNFYSNNNMQKGAALMVVVLFFLVTSSAIIFGAIGPIVIGFKSSQEFLQSVRAYATAEAGIEDVYYRIRNGVTVDSSETLSLNDGSVETTIITIDGNEKTIVSQATIASSTRIVQMDLFTGVGAAFSYGAQVGEGGLIMAENSRVEGAGGSAGNVYTNGPIMGANGATITGGAIVATKLDLDEKSETINQEQVVGNVNPDISFAQSFKPSDTKPIAKVSLHIKKMGNPVSRDVHIVADDGGKPATTALATGVLNASLVGTTPAWIGVVFPTPYTVTSGQTYWIVFDAKKNAANYWKWSSDSNQGFGNGVGMSSQDWADSGEAWSLVNGDLAFRVYFGNGVNAIDNVNVNGDARANTIKDSDIGGDAYYQTIENTTVSGTEHPGSTDPAILNMSISQANVDQWKTDALIGGTIVGDCGDTGVAECVINDDGTLSLGPKHITGNITLTKKQTLIVTGVLHVEGNIDMNSGGGSTIKCSSSFAGDSCIIVVDGWVNISQNATFAGSGDPNSYIMLLTTLKDCNGSGSGCGDHGSAIDIQNNATGALFYATDSLIYMHNGVGVTSVTGYTLQLEQNAVITYEIGVADLNFSSGPSGGWNVRDWREAQ